METWEIEQRIYELQTKLDYLKEKVETNYHQAYGTDVKYEQETKTRGSKTEIEALEDQIAQYKHTLETRKENKQNSEEKLTFNEEDYDKKQKEEEKALKQEKETERLETFKSIKEMYKKTPHHGFDRLVASIRGKSPKWRSVKKYTQEELDYVLQSLEGKTITRELAAKRIEERKISAVDKVKKIKQGNWNSFVELLNSKGKVQSRMREEEIMKGGYRF